MVRKSARTGICSPGGQMRRPEGFPGVQRHSSTLLSRLSLSSAANNLKGKGFLAPELVRSFATMYGKGKKTDSRGATYRGTFMGGKLNGQGEKKCSKGIIYSGRFKDNKLTGIGKIVFPLGYTYEGTFMNDLLHGEGKITDLLGNTYVSRFLNGKLEESVNIAHSFGKKKSEKDIYSLVYMNGENECETRISFFLKLIMEENYKLMSLNG